MNFYALTILMLDKISLCLSISKIKKQQQYASLYEALPQTVIN